METTNFETTMPLKACYPQEDGSFIVKDAKHLVYDYCVQCGHEEVVNGVGLCADCDRGWDLANLDLLGLPRPR